MNTPKSEKPGEVDQDQILVLVNSDDEVIGTLDKESCHAGRGVLHRALSVFLFNEAGELLIQQRARNKPLWGGYWSNSCCTHPYPGELTGTAAKRRVSEELGLDASLKYLYKFEYEARFNEYLSERELCSVYIGQSFQTPNPDPCEIATTRWMTLEDVDDLLKNHSNLCTPWFSIEWGELRLEFNDQLFINK